MTSFRLRYWHLVLSGNDFDARIARVVFAGRDHALERSLVRSLEMAERLGADLTDAAVFVLAGEDVLLAAGLNARAARVLHRESRPFPPS